MKLAIVALTGCDGCEYNLVNRDFFNLLEQLGVEIVYWPLAGISRELEEVDVALVEGSVVSERDVRLLYEVRGRAKYLVALGSCAHLGGVQGAAGVSKPIGSFVKVDYYLRGCPIQLAEVLELVKKTALGFELRAYRKRFSYVERETKVINGGPIWFDQSKCFVCGRCIELCSRVGAKVLSYVHRGIQTLVSTPFGESLANSNCVYCGLCAAYCPAGAVSYRLDVDRVLAEARKRLVVEAYVEPEVLASISEAEGLTPLQVVSGLRALGFKRVTIYDPLSVIDAEKSVLVARSPAEKLLLQKTLPDLEIAEVRVSIPPGTAYITQCTSWKRVLPRVLTAREIQIALKKLDYHSLRDENPDYVLYRKIELPKINSLTDLQKIKIERATVFELCPRGCLLGGGQPVSNNKKVGDVFRDRQNRLSEIENLSK
ncbi:MAG: hypothetical protein RMI56_00890 [Sulfolobales archaeon]|nr:hypothetical protein [Sulfolobales archaeon]MDW8082335.1 hypothetical protein [Sulfolobales archaeon]